MIKRAAVAVAVAAAAFWLTAEPAAAHGVGGRLDLPLPAWQLAWAAGFAVASSFVVLGLFWHTPRLAAVAMGTALPSAIQTIGRILIPAARALGLFVFGVVMYAAWWGADNSATNIAPTALFVTFWVGIQVVSVVLGDLWRAFNPLLTIADAGAWLRARVTGTAFSEPDRGAGNQWWAVAAIASFAWFELAYHASGSPRSIAVYLTVYSAAVLAGGLFFGRGWVRDADGFGVLFTKLAAIAPLHRDSSGTWRIRPPLAGLATLERPPGSMAFVLVVLGSTTFDGFTRSSIWLDVISNRSGWEATIVSTLGLAFIVGVVATVYRAATHLMSVATGDSEPWLASTFATSLVPILIAYALAHYFSLLVLEGQAIIFHVSDPFGRGWDLFGTIDYRIDYTTVTPDTIAWVQTVSIAVGHVLGITAAHDRAVELYDRRTAIRSQYPMLAIMVFYTVTGLFLLLGT